MQAFTTPPASYEVAIAEPFRFLNGASAAPILGPFASLPGSASEYPRGTRIAVQEPSTAGVWVSQGSRGWRRSRKDPLTRLLQMSGTLRESSELVASFIRAHNVLLEPMCLSSEEC